MVLKIPFQRYIIRPQDIKFAVVKWKINFCSCYVTADQGGQKNRNGKTIAILFHHVFY